EISGQCAQGADWLIEKSRAKPDGLIFSEHASETPRYMEGHGLATLFLAGVCRRGTGKGPRKKLTEGLMRCAKYIDRAQSSQGGWYHTSKVEGHDLEAILPTVIQFQALHAADSAGIPVSDSAYRKAYDYLSVALGKADEKTQAGRKNRLADTAAAL